MSEATPEGLFLDRQPEIRAKIIEQFKAYFGDTIRSDDQARFGIFATIFSEREANQNKLIEAVSAAHNPSKAADVYLSELVKYNGIRRNESEFSTVILSVTANAAGTTITAGSLVEDPDTGSRVAIDNEEVVAPNDTKDVSATATEEGPLEFPPGSLTKIVNAKYGWESVTNANKEVPGAFVESDPELRARREVAASQTSKVGDAAIFTEVGDIQEVTDRQVTSNRGNSVDLNGVPPGAVWTIVEGGADADIAKAIYDHTSAGIGWHGSITENYTDPDSGVTYPVQFSRPAYIDISHVIRTNRNPEFGDFPGDGVDQIKAKVVDYYETNQKLGLDVSIARISAVAMEVPGHSVQAVEIERTAIPRPPSQSDVVIDLYEKAQTDTSKIDVVVS